MYSTENFLKQPISKIRETMENAFNVSGGKLPNLQENLVTELKKFQITLQKVSNNNKFNSKELNETMAIVKKAGYDIDNLPTNYKGVLDKTYAELSNIHSQDPRFYDNTFISTYKNIYETVHSTNYKKFVKSFINDSKSFSGENLADFNNLLSQEAFPLFGSIGSKLGSTTGRAVGKAIATTITPTTTVVIVCSIITSLMLVALCIIAMSYLLKKKELVESQLTIQSINDDDKDLINNVVKPMTLCDKFIKKIVDNPKFNTKKLFAKENLDQSSEGVFFGIAFIIAALITILPSIRMLIYHFAHFKLRMHEFFDEQGEMLLVNVSELEEKIAKTNDKHEKERLTKIIEKQKKTSSMLYKISDKMYREKLSVSYRVDEELEEDEKIYKKNSSIDFNAPRPIDNSDYSLDNPLPPGSVLF